MLSLCLALCSPLQPLTKMHSVPTPALITLSMLLTVALSLIASSESKPAKSCTNWCIEESDQNCCSTGKGIQKSMFHWAMEQLLDLNNDPWTSIGNNWMYYLWPIVFPRSSSSHN